MASRRTTDPTLYRLLLLPLPYILQKVRIVTIKLAKSVAWLLYSCCSRFLLCLNTFAVRLMYLSFFRSLCRILMNMSAMIV